MLLSNVWSGNFPFTCVMCNLFIHCFVVKVAANVTNSAQKILCRLYAFDVHCNSFFPAFVILYGKQYQYIFVYLNVCLQLVWYLILQVFMISASIFSVTSVGRAWLLSSTFIESTLCGGNFLLSLPELSRI